MPNFKVQVSKVGRYWPLCVFALLFLYYFAPVMTSPSSVTLGYWGDKVNIIQNVARGGVSECTSQPLMQGLTALTGKLTPPVATYNFWVMLSFPLAFGTAYLLFRRLLSSALVAAVLALVFAFSPHHVYQSYNHLALAQVWLIPLVFLTLVWLEEDLRWFRACVAGLFFALVTLISNYYGFFALLTAAAFGLTGGIVGIIPYLKIRTAPVLKVSFLSVSLLQRAIIYFALAVVCFLVVSFSRYAVVRANFLGGESVCPKSTLHSVEGFVLYSARPWHFLIPPVDHPVLGDWARGVQVTFSEKDYFLFTPFFPEEQGGLFLGWANLLLAALAVSLLVTSVSPIPLGDNRRWLLLFLLVGLILVVLSAPPIFTLFGRTIYLPSWLILRFFPMFRCLSRLGTFIFPCALVLVGYTLDTVQKEHSRYFVAVLLCYLTAALFELLILPDFWPVLPGLF